jgi:hypothetical protein
MKSKYLITIAFILTLLMFSFVLAADLSTSSVALKTGLNEGKDAHINITGGEISILDTKSGVEMTATTIIDGKLFEPALTKTDGNNLILGTGEKSWFIFDDPTTKFKYTYNGNTLKETVTLKERPNYHFR